MVVGRLQWWWAGAETGPFVLPRTDDEKGLSCSAGRPRLGWLNGGPSRGCLAQLGWGCWTHKGLMGGAPGQHPEGASE